MVEQKEVFVLLVLLIPRPRSITSEDFDVFLEPLVGELLTLWEGAPGYNALKDLEFKRFTLQVVLLWII